MQAMRGNSNPLSSLMASYMPTPKVRETWLREYVAKEKIKSERQRMYFAQPLQDDVPTSYNTMVRPAPLHWRAWML